MSLSTQSRRLACVALTVVASAATQAGPHVVRAESDHVVLAYYYGMGSGDVRQQERQAQAAGIDGFIVWWDGIGGGRDQQLIQVLEAARATGFKATIHFHAWGANLYAEMRGFYEQRLGDPGLVTYQGRPVLFFWATWQFPNSYWSELRNRLDPDRRAIWLADGDQFGTLSSDAWDGISPYAIAWSANPRGQLPAWAVKARAVAPEKLWVPPVSPGCNDSAVRAATCVQDRADGAYYRATWDGALASSPQWAIVVSTWDEWSEQTAIEPGDQYGDLYTSLTRAYADEWKGASTTMQPVAPEPEPEPAPPQPMNEDEPAS
jgi:hypothetical protein